MKRLMKMFHLKTLWTPALAFCSIAAFLPAASLLADDHAKPVIMIVHGAWGGGWAFKETENLLRESGFEVYRPTLTGQGEKAHLAMEKTGLNTHIQDIVGVLQFEDLHDVILVGHSYGGIVVTGAADREAERIKQLIYLDALIPENGESWQQLSTEQGRAWLEGTIQGHGLVPPWVGPDQAPPKDVPHPLLAYTEPIQLNNEAAREIPASFILTVEDPDHPESDEFARFADRARERGWPVHQLESDHNPQWSAVKPLVELLVEIATD
jgi:pimeloyl-ACP methyl ester carboxylesterase